ncbi:hypothetical protein MAN88_22270 [Microcystis aeruginosa]|nr:hypothetical protein MAN88_22270 [Microcystis aeruginosa]
MWVLSDRITERQRLQTQRQQLELSLKKLPKNWV